MMNTWNPFFWTILLLSFNGHPNVGILSVIRSWKNGRIWWCLCAFSHRKHLWVSTIQIHCDFHLFSCVTFFLSFCASAATKHCTCYVHDLTAKMTDTNNCMVFKFSFGGERARARTRVHSLTLINLVDRVPSNRERRGARDEERKILTTKHNKSHEMAVKSANFLCNLNTDTDSINWMRIAKWFSFQTETRSIRRHIICML